MKFKYFCSSLFLFSLLFASCLTAFAKSEVIFYKDESKICTPCSKGIQKMPYPTHNVTSTRLFAQKLDSKQKKSYCKLANKAVNELKSAFLVNLNSEENTLFNISSREISKFFSLTLPNVNSLNNNKVETADFIYTFYSDNICESIGFCYAVIDLNKNLKPNSSHLDIIYVNFLYDGRTLKMEEFPAAFYKSIMCEE